MLTFGEAARLVGGRLEDVALTDRPMGRLLPLDAAGPGDLSFVTQRRYAPLLANCRAQAVLLDDTIRAQIDLPQALCPIVCDDAMVAVATLQQHLVAVPRVAQGRSPHAMVHPEAYVHPSAHLAAGAVVERQAHIGAHCQLGAHSYIGEGATLGEGCIVHAGAHILWGCALGRRVILQPGAIIGSDGFGYAQRRGSAERIKVPQTGTVVLEDDVEVGANTTIDRATFGTTCIGARTKIDNLVQIAHNVTIGTDCVVVSQSGIAGSTRVGHRVIVGAQVGVVGHIDIADDVILAARAGVAGSIKEAGVYAGAPSMPHSQWLRAMALVRRLPELVRRLPRSAQAGASTQGQA